MSEGLSIKGIFFAILALGVHRRCVRFLRGNILQKHTSKVEIRN
jgi:hypothetical protein